MKSPLELIDAYVLDMQRAGLAFNTQEKRRGYLTSFANDIGLSASKESINLWIDERQPSLKTRSIILSHLSCFYEWAIHEHYLETNPIADIRRPKVPKSKPRPMPRYSVQKAITHASPKMLVWLLLMGYAGLRDCEVAALDREDILEVEGYIRVQGKGGREGIVPLHPVILSALEAWGMPETGPLFAKRTGGHISAADVSHLTSRYLHRHNITSTPHTMRHWFGTEMLRITKNLKTVQELMRHADIGSTVLYTALDQREAQEAVSSLQIGA